MPAPQPAPSPLTDRARQLLRAPGAPAPRLAAPADGPAGKPPPAPEGITANDLLGLEFAPTRFLVDGLLPDGLTVLAGKPKHGKSWLALLLGWAVAAGEAVDGRAARQGEVLYLALEDTRRRLKERLLKLRAATGWPVPETLTLHTQYPRAADGGLYHVAEWLDRHRERGGRLVIVDTLAKFRQPPRGSGNSYAEDYEALGGLKELLDTYDAAGLVLHHTRKLRSEDPFDEVSGTLAITGAADSIWMLDTQTKGEQARLYATGRDVADGTVPLRFDRESGRWSLGPTADGIDTSGRAGAAAGATAGTKVEQCAAWLKEFLRAGAHPSKEIEQAAKVAGYTFSTLRDAKIGLGKQGTGEIVNHKFGHGEWWSGLGPVGGWKYRPGKRPAGDSCDSSDSSPNHWQDR